MSVINHVNVPTLEVRGVAKSFLIRSGWFTRAKRHVHAVNGVSFAISEGETLGLVGESGCGKSTLAKIILQLTRQTAGKVFFQGSDLSEVPQPKMKAIRKELQIIFQDPYSSLNPRMTVGEMLSEAMQVHQIAPKKDIESKIEELLLTVGLNAFHSKRYPHEFSSGQRQRIGIARALSVDPSCIVCDEPVSALDVSIQAQILNLLMDLKDKYRLTYLFISHDLSIVRHISDRIAVMYLGKIVELGAAGVVGRNSLHPYTTALMDTAPVPDPEALRTRTPLRGDVPNPASIPPGCSFHTRCPHVFEACRTVEPRLGEYTSGHFVRCLLHQCSWPDERTMHLYQRQHLATETFNPGTNGV